MASGATHIGVDPDFRIQAPDRSLKSVMVVSERGSERERAGARTIPTNGLTLGVRAIHKRRSSKLLPLWLKGSETTKNCANMGYVPRRSSHPVRRSGVHVETMTRGDFRISYFALARRYHPDRNPRGAELMANINAARAAILNSYRSSAP